MAEKEEPHEGEASRQESFLDQFLRRLDQTDQEAAATSTSGATTMAAAPSPSSDAYSSLTTIVNPWSFMSTPHPNPDLPTQAALQSPMYRASSPSPYSLPANPLAEFPWLLEEFDQQQKVVAGDPDAHDSAQRLYSSYTTQEPQAQILRPSSGGSPQGDPFKDEPARWESASSIQAGGHGSSSAKLDAGPVPRFGEPGASSAVVVSKQMSNYRPPTSPLLSEVGAGAGSVTTSAGTSNTSLSSESTSNAGDEDESEVKKDATEGASSGKRKKPEAESAGAAAGETPESKKSDQPKNKPRKRGGAKRLREPRYAIKTRTDVDVLDDGFKWRKYGQKAVKNSPHPRNYYRCTTPLCPVRKRVERSNEDSGLVVTTYEGTHTHQTPGFHRSSGGYFGDRPLGMGGGVFQSPLGPNSTLLPLPPGFDLASLQQATALRNIRGLQPNQNPNQNLLPGSSSQQQQQLRQQLGFQQESLFRAQQFLGLQDGPSGPFGSVKQEPFHFTSQDFMSRNLSLPSLPMMTPSQLLNRTLSDNALQRPGSSPMFTGLNFPHLQSSGGLNISGPASSSNICSDSRGQQGRHHELQPGVGGSSSRIDQSLETLVSSSSGHPNFSDQGQGGAGPDQPQPGSNIQTRGGQQRTTMQQQHQHQHNIRSVGPAVGGLSSTVSSESLQGQAGSHESETGAREGLLQDMVRHGGPKLSKN